jgi:hypothetical protein
VSGGHRRPPNGTVALGDGTAGLVPVVAGAEVLGLLIRLGHRPPTDAGLRIMRRAALMVGLELLHERPAAVPEPRFGNDWQSPNGAPPAESRDASSTERATVSQTGT